MNGLVSGYGSDSDGQDTDNESIPTSTAVSDKNKAENSLQNDG